MRKNNEIILYSTPDGDKKVGVLYHDENFWLTQKALAVGYGTSMGYGTSIKKSITFGYMSLFIKLWTGFTDELGLENVALLPGGYPGRPMKDMV